MNNDFIHAQIRMARQRIGAATQSLQTARTVDEVVRQMRQFPAVPSYLKAMIPEGRRLPLLAQQRIDQLLQPWLTPDKAGASTSLEHDVPSALAELARLERLLQGHHPAACRQLQALRRKLAVRAEP